MPLVKVENLKKFYEIRKSFASSFLSFKKSYIRAVDGVNFQIDKGKTLGLVGESGSGKSTIGKLLVLLEIPTQGSIKFKGEDVIHLKRRNIRDFRKKVQIIFQDPYDSLDPRYTVFNTLNEVLTIHHVGCSKKEKSEIIFKMLEAVELRPPEEFIDRLPHELSGGQRQRVAIARAMILNPEFVVADEPVSMLDASVRTGIMNLLISFKEQSNIAYLFISHDLSVTRYICDDIAVMYLGKIVESGPTEKIINNMVHPYTKALISAVPVPDPKHKRSPMKVGELLSMAIIPEGCRFHPRCPFIKDICKQKEPDLKEFSKNHFVACHLY